ncbi:polysaccharide pyruvyl transferase family protein [Roseomonas sp. SSH11]|uniref:Polysaccharide pyruvyl transferase family protein n=1 Tax=Pararoseomonas baculiformis TaxID=2820812 RepID=A0ABS4ADG7_9PROT|nr:polysaccharide pyruvyl transferase family protein [Pararoseomonas baculiformis]MBP0445055.1 polysaccharide pyruvyl transferase family protein [Pararoseomonas baculiformis]
MAELESPRRVLVTGTFDVANYGDLLFPLVAAHRLNAAGIKVVPVSPTANLAGYSDAPRPIEAAAMTSTDAQGVLIGGGYIIIGRSADTLPPYQRAGVAGHAYPSLWMGATLAGAVLDVPVVWNAPGAPHPFSAARREALVTPALRAASYLAVRDCGTARLLDAEELAIEVVPDTALDLPKLWPLAGLREVFRNFLARKHLAGDTACLALHVRARSLASIDVGTFARRLDDLARRHQVLPLLLVLGPVLGDLPVLRALSEQLTVPHILLDDAVSLRELAAAIAFSACYLGGSLHGYVTAAAYGTPGALVALPARPKYSGLVEQIGRAEDLAVSWDEGFLHADALLTRRGRTILPGHVGQALDRHWTRVVQAFGDREIGRKPRADFLRAYMREGARLEGAGWAVGAHLSGPGPGPRQGPGGTALAVGRK